MSAVARPVWAPMNSFRRDMPNSLPSASLASVTPSVYRHSRSWDWSVSFDDP